MNRNRSQNVPFERFGVLPLCTVTLVVQLMLLQVLEETGFDLERLINLDDMVEVAINEQTVSLFIVPNIPESFAFETRTRKEISVSYAILLLNGHSGVVLENIMVQTVRFAHMET